MRPVKAMNLLLRKYLRKNAADKDHMSAVFFIKFYEPYEPKKNFMT